MNLGQKRTLARLNASLAADPNVWIRSPKVPFSGNTNGQLNYF